MRSKIKFVPTTVEVYNYMLEVMPPRSWYGNLFLVGEPYSHNDKGEAVYQCFDRTPLGDYIASKEPLSVSDARAISGLTKLVSVCYDYEYKVHDGVYQIVKTKQEA